MDDENIDNNTCERLEVDVGGGIHPKKIVFVRGTWDLTSFCLAVFDGLRAWTFDGSDKFVKERADVWDKPESWVMEKIQLYLSARQPDTKYSFTSHRGDGKMLVPAMHDDGYMGYLEGHSQLSFEIQHKDGDMKLIANLPMQQAPSAETITVELLDFLLEKNCVLSVKYRRKSLNFDRVKKEADACLEQSERFKNEKVQFEQDIYKKFVAVLNSKKMKLKELRDELAKWTAAIPKSKEENESEAETSESGSDEDENVHADNGNNPGTSKPGPSSSSLRILSSKPEKEGETSGREQKETSGAQAGENEKGDAEQKVVASGATKGKGENLVDVDATQPFEDVEINDGTNIPEVSKEAVIKDVGPSDAAAALLEGSTYISAPRKRRRM